MHPWSRFHADFFNFFIFIVVVFCLCSLARELEYIILTRYMYLTGEPFSKEVYKNCSELMTQLIVQDCVG